MFNNLKKQQGLLSFPLKTGQYSACALTPTLLNAHLLFQCRKTEIGKVSCNRPGSWEQRKQWWHSGSNSVSMVCNIFSHCHISPYRFLSENERAMTVPTITSELINVEKNCNTNILSLIYPELWIGWSEKTGAFFLNWGKFPQTFKINKGVLPKLDDTLYKT